MIIAGCDPHFTKLAFSLVEYTKEKGRSHIRTDYFPIPDLAQKKKSLRQSEITNQKLEKIFLMSYRWLKEYKPDAFGIEGFQAFSNPKSGFSVGKTTIVKMSSAVTAVKCAVFAMGKFPMEGSAQGTRWAVLNKKGGSKEEVWEAVFPRYPNLKFPNVAEGNKEHIYDSLAIAEVALLDILEQIKRRGALEI